MTEQIMVSFGNQILKWKDAQFALLHKHQSWKEALYKYVQVESAAILREWDIDGDGLLGKHACCWPP